MIEEDAVDPQTDEPSKWFGISFAWFVFLPGLVTYWIFGLTEVLLVAIVLASLFAIAFYTAPPIRASMHHYYSQVTRPSSQK